MMMFKQKSKDEQIPSFSMKYQAMYGWTGS